MFFYLYSYWSLTILNSHCVEYFDGYTPKISMLNLGSMIKKRTVPSSYPLVATLMNDGQSYNFLDSTHQNQS